MKSLGLSFNFIFSLLFTLLLSMQATAEEAESNIIDLQFEDYSQCSDVDTTCNRTQSEFVDTLSVEYVDLPQADYSVGKGYLYQSDNRQSLDNAKAIGIQRETALRMSGVVNQEQLENDDPCSSRHNQGDVSNRWCHAYFSQLAHTMLKENGHNEYIAQAGGLLVFMVKELGDLNYDWGDVNTAPIGGKINETTESYVTLMMDGSFHVYVSADF